MHTDRDINFYKPKNAINFKSKFNDNIEKFFNSN